MDNALWSKKEAEKLDRRANGFSAPEEPTETAAYKFQRNFTNDEMLHIMEDFVQGRKLLQSP